MQTDTETTNCRMCCAPDCPKEAAWGVGAVNQPDAHVEVCDDHVATHGLTLAPDNKWIADRYPLPSFTVWALADWKYEDAGSPFPRDGEAADAPSQEGGGR